MAKKLQNIKAIKQMIEGTHRTQTKNNVGMYTGKTHQIRKVGEKWEETINGTLYEIEQRDGYRVKKPKNSIAEDVKTYLNSFPNCKKDCTCTTPSSLDKKMRAIHGMCFDCVVEMEHDLKKQGKYEEYERNKIRNNAEAWLKRAEDDVRLLKDAYTKSSEVVQNAEGDIETWHAKMSPDEFNDTVQQQFIRIYSSFIEYFYNK